MNNDRADISSTVVETAEREKRHLARELHHSVIQSLTAISIEARIVSRRLQGASGEQMAELKCLQAAIDHATDEASLLMRQLQPPDIEDTGLGTALAELAASVRGKIACRVQCAPDVCIDDPDTALALFRIAQEAIIYLQKPSASQITLSLIASRQSVTLEVHDNGRAMPSAAGNSQGPDAEMMRSYASFVGAELTIKQGDSGTCITCIAPLRPE